MDINNKRILAVINPELAQEWHPTKNEKKHQKTLLSIQVKKFGGNVK